MGKALSGELSCPCDKSCFVNRYDIKVKFVNFPIYNPLLQNKYSNDKLFMHNNYLQY